MYYTTQTDYDTFYVLPLVGIQLAKCDNPDCEGTHGIMLAVGWGFWVIELIWEF